MAGQVGRSRYRYKDSIGGAFLCRIGPLLAVGEHAYALRSVSSGGSSANAGLDCVAADYSVFGCFGAKALELRHLLRRRQCIATRHSLDSLDELAQRALRHSRKIRVRLTARRENFRF